MTNYPTDLEDADDIDDLDDESTDDESHSTESARELAALERKKATEFRFIKVLPRGCDANAATIYAEEHFSEILKGTSLPGLRGKILHELMLIDLLHKVRTEFGFSWQIDRPLPPFAPVQQIRTIIGHIRGFPLLTGFEFKGTPTQEPDTIALTIRLHGKAKQLHVTLKEFAELEAPTGQWQTLMGKPATPAKDSKVHNGYNDLLAA